MNSETLALVGPYIFGLLPLILSGLAIYYARHERRARVSNLDADTIQKNSETIAEQRDQIEGQRIRLDNLQSEIGEERSLRRRDKQEFEKKIAAMGKQHNEEIASIRSQYDYKIKALDLRIKELEDELGRSERERLKVIKELDAARAENHGLLEENYELRQKLAGKTGKGTP